MYNLQGKNAIVTGGASGIGYNIVNDLLIVGVNKCVILDINTVNGEGAVKKFAKEFGKDRIYFMKCDISKMDEFEDVMKSVMSVLKTLHIFINNAGVMDEIEWAKNVAVNINGVVNGTILAMRYMGKNHGGNGGTIINVSSIVAFEIFAGCPVYTGTKHFIVGFTRSWGIPYHYNKTGVRMMVLSPGITRTDMSFNYRMKEEDKEEFGKQILNYPKQEATGASAAVIYILLNGENNSVWMSEGDEVPYEITIPGRFEMRKMK